MDKSSASQGKSLKSRLVDISEAEEVMSGNVKVFFVILNTPDCKKVKEQESYYEQNIWRTANEEVEIS